jgi:metallo-beta-lactamase family protein
MENEGPRPDSERKNTMKLHFYGADQCVTGSCHCIEINGKHILVDCGLQQGRDEIDNGELPFHAGSIDYVLVTHAHIDHTGRIPMLIKQGFTGRILTTRLTGQLMDIMLQDSAHIQESDAEWKTRKAQRAGLPAVEPLYTVEDAQKTMQFVDTCEYGEKIDLCEGVRVRFIDAGHLLGSGSIELTLTEDGKTKVMVFSGDIGNVDQPIICDPQFYNSADYVVMESTYGDRNHTEVWSYTDDLAAIIDETMAKGGNGVIPSFAVGRTQELLYFIREIKDKHLVKSVPNFAVYVDSPLAKKATTLFCGDLRGYLDEAALALVKDGTHMFNFPDLHLTEGVEESKLINAEPTPKVIISASGMCDAGRIRHHLKHNLWRPESTIVFVGFQSPGTLGRHLLDGADHVKMFGEEIAVKAKIVNFQGLSSHADHDHLVAWIQKFGENKPQHVFVVHGDREVAPVFADELVKLGFTAHAPQYTEEYDLIADKKTAEGYLPERKVRAYDGAPKSTPAYERLTQTADMLQNLIRRSKGRDNKSLAALSEQLKQLMEKFGA